MFTNLSTATDIIVKLTTKTDVARPRASIDGGDFDVEALLSKGLFIQPRVAVENHLVAAE